MKRTRETQKAIAIATRKGGTQPVGQTSTGCEPEQPPKKQKTLRLVVQHLYQICGDDAHTIAGIDARQYVNLQSDNDQPRHGVNVRLEARVGWTGGSGKSLKGHTVYWSVEATLQPRPSGVHSQWGYYDGRYCPKTETVTNDYGVTEIWFVCSRHGGDRFVLRVSADAEGDDSKSATLTVWRKLRYGVHWMKTKDGKTSYASRFDDRALAERAASCFVEAVRLSTGCLTYSACIRSEDAAKEWVTKLREPEVTEPYVHMVACHEVAGDQVDSTETTALKATRWQGVFKIMVSSSNFLFANAVRQVRFRVGRTKTMQVFDGTSEVLMAGNSYQIHLSWKPGGAFDKALAAPFGPPKPQKETQVVFEVDLTSWTPLNGVFYRQTGTMFVACSDSHTTIPTTSFHELLHALHLVQQKLEFTNGVAIDHPTCDTVKPRHCTKKTCVMYYTPVPERTGDPCDACRLQVLAHKLAKIQRTS